MDKRFGYYILEKVLIGAILEKRNKGVFNYDQITKDK
jgi:hypothetical protein